MVRIHDYMHAQPGWGTVFCNAEQARGRGGGRRAVVPPHHLRLRAGAAEDRKRGNRRAGQRFLQRAACGKMARPAANRKSLRPPAGECRRPRVRRTHRLGREPVRAARCDRARAAQDAAVGTRAPLHGLLESHRERYRKSGGDRREKQLHQRTTSSSSGTASRTLCQHERHHFQRGRYLPPGGQLLPAHSHPVPRRRSHRHKGPRAPLPRRGSLLVGTRWEQTSLDR
mmetsp:Transcript_25181/g.63381  ORF Transcript_25181/g.63381 Transcript_25181/m.63381 type:complete len:227 (-) Transcript_25181:743-1423(-)